MNARSRLLRALRRREKGQTLVLAALFMVIIMGFGALVIDVARFMHGQEQVQNAVDAAALAAAAALPSDSDGHGHTSQQLANTYIAANDPSIQSGQVSVTYRCIVGDRNHDGSPDQADLTAVCNPAGAHWSCSNGICISPCTSPSVSNKCNTVVVGASKDVPFVLAPVLGIFQDSTGSIKAAACSGACGSPPTIPLDIVIIIDRTNSMSTQDLDDAKTGARAALQIFDPSLQHVALGVLPQSVNVNPYYQAVANQYMNDPDTQGIWVPVGLSSDYKNADGTLKESSTLVSTLGTDHSHGIQIAAGASNVQADNDCLPWGSDFCRQTGLGYAVKKAKEYLQAHGRSGVKWGIILLTDGGANQPRLGRQACKYGSDQAALARAAGIEIFTIGYGVGGTNPDPGVKDCEDLSGGWQSGQHPEHDLGTQLLADMATSSADDHDGPDTGIGGCSNSTEIAAENADGDHFLCEAKGTDLSAVFEQAVVQMTSSAHLIQVPN